MNHGVLFFVIVTFWWLSNPASSDSAMQAPSLRSGIPVPYFYQLFKDGTATEDVQVGKVYKVEFYGKNFGRGDLAKLVVEGENCSTGKPAGHLPMSSVIFVSEELSQWVLYVKKSGTYAVCYFHSTHREWIEVNPRAGRPIPEEEEVVTTEPPSPDCPTLPENQHQFPYTVVGAMVEKSLGNEPREVIGELSAFIARILCLTPSSIATLQLRSSGRASGSKGESFSWYFTIVCSHCNYTERMNYLYYYFGSKQQVFLDVGIVSLRGEFHVPVEVENEKTNGSDAFTLLLFFMCLLFFLGGVLCLCILRRERDRREQFDGMDNGFGLLDGDMEDLFPAASEGEGVVPHDHSQGNGGYSADVPIGLIEVEE